MIYPFSRGTRDLLSMLNQEISPIVEMTETDKTVYRIRI